ncbi:MAG: hypothetical protein IT260_11935 [Saprospiraceae bacterium]|nr:hypothetical protein [Saprospiraceae bacterium]
MPFHLHLRFQFLPRRHLKHCLLLTGLCSILACKEPPPTVIQGTVANSKTGAPIAGAVGFLQFYKKNKNFQDELDIKTFSTDAKGKFEISPSFDYTGVSPSYIEKKGFVTHHYLDIQKGIVNSLDIKMIPIDAIFRLRIKNTSSAQDTIYPALHSPSFAKELRKQYGYTLPKKFPIILPAGGEYMENIPMPSDEYTKVCWGFNPYPYPDYFSNSICDSVYLLPGDTMEYLITF